MILALLAMDTGLPLAIAARMPQRARRPR